jgi:hypothetical protein
MVSYVIHMMSFFVVCVSKGTPRMEATEDLTSLHKSELSTMVANCVGSCYMGFSALTEIREA